jgi:energy coupling factor transporter S component ThiW
VQNNNIRKLTVSSALIALGVILSPIFVINLGVVKASPTQHLINVVSAVLLGPWYALANAFIISVIRNILGTGSLLAFPGSMVGALLAGLIYRRFQLKWACALGEVFGTGVIGALLAYPMAVLFLGSQQTALFFIFIFSASTLCGALIGYVLLRALPLEHLITGQLGDHQ